MSQLRITERLAPLAAVASALATLACCLPLGIAGAIGALGLSVALASLRPWLLGCAVILLGVSFVQIYRGQKSCRRNSRLSLIVFGLSAAIVLAVMVFPQRIAELLAAIP
jgi:hypothetical protein